MSGMALLVLGALAALAVGSVFAGYAVAAVSWWLAVDRPPLVTRLCAAVQQCGRAGGPTGFPISARPVPIRRSGLRPGS